MADKQEKNPNVYEKKTVYEAAGEEIVRKAYDYAVDYVKYLDTAKTEREAVEVSVKMAEAAGYRPYRFGDRISVGDKFYYNNRGKNLFVFRVGTEPINEGIRITCAHIDSPRLDLKQNPVFESSDMAFFKTHYYGGIRKYQWLAMPLALHGVVVRENGEVVNITVGENEDEPVMYITDLLPHLAAAENAKTVGTAFSAEKLNILIGSRPLAARVSDAMASVPGITDVKLSRDLGVPEDRLVIDRDKANDLGVPVKEIADALRTILAGSEAGEFRENGDEYTILVKVKDADLLSLDQILDLSMRNSKGELVVLRNLINYERVKGPVNIERKNQERVLTVGGNIQDRDLGSVVRDIQAKLEDIPMPPGFTLLFSGDYEDQQESFRELMFAFSLALALVYMVMACQFESLRDPLVVMFSVPLAAIGVVLALFLTRTTFNLQSFIGVIMLAGIVVNNAILLVDTANLLRNEEGMPLEKAVREAGKRRLRPILMTTLTTVLGLFPLALGLGDGGETQAPMARAVIGGLTSSTVITLFFVPAVYLVAETLCSKKKTPVAD